MVNYFNRCIVRIRFQTKKLEKLANCGKTAAKALGPLSAKKLRARLDDLDAAEFLEDFRSLPGRCHELKGNLKGSLALDLHGGRRIVFEPDHDPAPVKEDEGLDWKQVTAVLITDMTDYHN